MSHTKSESNAYNWRNRHGQAQVGAPKAKKQAKVKKVMDEWKSSELHSGSKSGPAVTDQKQAIAIALSEARKGKK